MRIEFFYKSKIYYQILLILVFKYFETLSILFILKFISLCSSLLITIPNNITKIKDNEKYNNEVTLANYYLFVSCLLAFDYAVLYYQMPFLPLTPILILIFSLQA